MGHRPGASRQALPLLIAAMVVAAMAGLAPARASAQDWNFILPIPEIEERLRSLIQDDLDRALSVLAEFENREDVLVPVEPGENLARHQGVRWRGARVQFGLTASEIRDIEVRRTRLLQMVDRDRIRTF